MATTYGSAAPDFHDRPMAYVAIPLAIVVCLGLIAWALHAQRRRRLMKARLHYVGSNPGARRALERDLQEAWMRGAPQEERRQQRRATRRWSRNNAAAGGRWAWARDLLTARSEEGLNEFGEAPPPYDGRRRGSKIQEEGNVVELEVRSAGSGSGSGAETAADGSERHVEDIEAGQNRGRSSQQGLPPAYDGPPPGAAPGGTTPVAVPPPAVTRDSHSSGPAA
jgi:hypothetical protein